MAWNERVYRLQDEIQIIFIFNKRKQLKLNFRLGLRYSLVQISWKFVLNEIQPYLHSLVLVYARHYLASLL